MRKKRVLISCVPGLGDEQAIAIRSLIHMFREKECIVTLLSDEKNELLSDSYYYPGYFDRIRRIQGITRLNTFLENSLDKSKWIARLSKWIKWEGADNPERRYRNYMKEAAVVLHLYDPFLFICWNPYCCRFGVMYDAAKILGIRTAGIEWGFLPRTFILDKGGTLGASDLLNGKVISSDKEIELQEGLKIFEQLKNLSLSLYQQKELILPDELKLLSSKQVKVLILGIDEVDSGAIPEDISDRVGLLPFHKSSIDQALAFASADPSFVVVYKPHPSHNNYQRDEKVSENLFIINSNPDQLIEWADVVVCSGSKMEFSVLLKNKPLINVGAGLLYGRGCSYEISAICNIRDIVNEAKGAGVVSSQMEAFWRMLGLLKSSYLYSWEGGATNRHIIADILGEQLVSVHKVRQKR